VAQPLLIARESTMRPQSEMTKPAATPSVPERPVLWTPPKADAKPLTVGLSEYGCEWEDDFGHFCLLKDIYPEPLRARPETQVESLFDKLEELLAHARFSFSDVIRTWFFLDDILTIYDDFNRIRTQFFRERGLLGRAPASTAVGVSNRRGCAIEGHLLAFKPHTQQCKVAHAGSPEQGSAFDYGSAFSRGLSIHGTSRSRLYVSGTASIARDGKTLHDDGAMAPQVRETFRVVEALLAHHGYRFHDVVVANAYVPKDRSSLHAQTEWSHHLKLPFSSMPADVCRADLSFELELIAEKSIC
jgi:enamine deaminase RidA (YjgF/YER057c/UK114 family)